MTENQYRVIQYNKIFIPNYKSLDKKSRFCSFYNVKLSIFIIRGETKMLKNEGSK